jgi:hypothetical protein
MISSAQEKDVMKTARSIEEQEERKAARDNGKEGEISPELRQPMTQKKRRGDASRIAAWRFQPGKSGNPGGVPKHDIAKEIAQAIFANNADMIYAAYTKMLRKGNAYAYQVLSDRAFGKLKETIHAEVSPYREYTDEELQKRLHELEQKLGYVKVLPPSDDTPKPN